MDTAGPTLRRPRLGRPTLRRPRPRLATPKRPPEPVTAEETTDTDPALVDADPTEDEKDEV